VAYGLPGAFYGNDCTKGRSILCHLVDDDYALSVARDGLPRLIFCIEEDHPSVTYCFSLVVHDRLPGAVGWAFEIPQKCG